MKRQQGFTLVELLIALGIMAVFSLLSYRGLDSVLRLNTAAQVHQSKSAMLMRAMTQLEADLRQAQSVEWTRVNAQEQVTIKRRVSIDVDGVTTPVVRPVVWALTNGVWTRTLDNQTAQMLASAQSVQWSSYIAGAGAENAWVPTQVIAAQLNVATHAMLKAVRVSFETQGQRFEKNLLIGR